MSCIAFYLAGKPFTLTLTMLAVGTLLAVLGLLTGRAATVRTSNVLLLLGLGFHLASIRVLPFTATAKGNTILQYLLEILFSCHNLFSVNTPPLNREGQGWVLMMEQTYTGEGHRNTVLVASHDDMIVAY